MEERTRHRAFMKCPDLKGEMEKSDQEMKRPQPPLGKAAAGPVIELPPFGGALTRPAYMDLLDTRRSERSYSGAPVT
ncbi:MAG: hypothetical protein FWG93_07780, partial [Oscillospiraceae bacterium]|nr:hypothetical protein [Oscillospiraceae bacterium]